MRIIDLPKIKKTPEFARIHAHICGDGYTTHAKVRRSPKELIEHPRKNLIRDRYSIRYVNTENELVKKFAEDVKILLNRKVVKLRRHEYDVAGKWVYDLFVQSGTLKSASWFIPPEILDGTDELKKEWLKAFFDDESHVSSHRNRVEVNSINRKGILQVQELLKELGMEGRVGGPYLQKKPNHQPFYRIVIYSKNAKKFAELIGSYHPDKEKRLKDIIKRMSGDVGISSGKAHRP